MKRLLLCSIALVVQNAACKTDSEAGGGTTSAVPSAAPAPQASAPAPSAKPKPQATVAGDWTGTYDARHYLIEMSKKEGAVREWQADKGETHSGKGQLTLSIAPNGSVSGSSTGALGELSVVGELDGEQLRLQLSPVDPEKQPAFKGHLLAERKGDTFKGNIQASSGDSLTVRDAPAELRRKGSAEPK
jgi:hypothetical protein